MPSPTIKFPTAEEFRASFQEFCISKSGSKLSNFQEGSILSLLAEVMAQTVEEEISPYVNLLFPALIQYSWSLLGFSPKSKSTAAGQVRFQLAQPQQTDFSVPAGYRFSAGTGVLFETTLDLNIRANADTANPSLFGAYRVSCKAVDAGVAGNQVPQQCNILFPRDNLAGLFFDTDFSPSGGADDEGFESYYTRVASILRQRVGELESAPILSEGEHRDAVLAILGDATLVKVASNITPQGLSQIGAMSVYVLPSNGALSSIQRSALIAAIAPRSPLATGQLFYEPLPVALVNVEISISPKLNRGFSDLVGELNAKIREEFSLSSNQYRKELDIYLLIKTIYGVEGVDSADPAWAILPDTSPEASRLLLPPIGNTGETAIARINKITFINSLSKETIETFI